MASNFLLSWLGWAPSTLSTSLPFCKRMIVGTAVILYFNDTSGTCSAGILEKITSYKNNLKKIIIYRR